MKFDSTSWALAAGIMPAIVCAAPAEALGEFDFHHDGIIGTSCDLLVVSKSQSQAVRCEMAVLGEIERLRQILSIYDPASEISAVNRGGAVRSAELAELLDTYRLWEERTGGIITAHMGHAIAQCKSRAQMGELNIDALGKAYVIERAAAIAAQFAPAGILDIGGDLRAWGDRAWTVGIADPHNPAENAPSIGTIELRNGAVATSGGYARGAHLIDPRTATPAGALSSATVVADDCITANALATAACVAGEDALQCRDDSVRGWMLVDTSGRRTCAGYVADCQAVALAEKPALWPKDFQVSIQLALLQQQGRKTHRPYLCLWVEAADGTVVRNIAVWGKERKYLRDMSYWWKATGGKDDVIRAVSRASRNAGQYTVTWDGTDDKGNALPRGEYTIRMEINREKGRHINESIKLQCGDAKQSATIRATAESAETAIEYGPRTDKK